MITINQISHHFGKKTLFNKINTVIGARDRIALVGSNGSGKTTLLRMFMGELEPESGSVDKPDYVSIGYLPQDGISVSGNTLFKEAESAFGDVLELKNKIDQAEEQMAEMDTSEDAYYDLIDQMGEWEQQLEDHEPHKMKSRVERILMGMGFKASDFDRDTGEFSGGWQMRIALAKLLLQNPSLIILDEPTNHLDIISQHWVEQYLKHYQGALIVISHDRAFLDEVTDRTLELKMGDLNSFKGNYSYYVTETDKRLEILRKSYANQQKEIKDAEEELPLLVEQPQFLQAEVTYTEPGVKGDTATNTMKPATIDTGAKVKVPLFINTGDMIKVDIQKSMYVERVKS